MADRDVRVRLSAQVSQFMSAMAQAGAASTAAAAKMGRDWQAAGASMQSMGRTMSVGVTLPLVGLGVSAVRAGQQFNGAFTRMQALAGVTASEMGGLRDRVLELSRQTGRGPTELANALYTLRSSGLDADQAMSALSMSAKASAVGLGNTAVIADAVSSAMNAYATSGLTAAEATDVLVATARAGKAEPDELAASLGRILPISSELGVSFQEVGGAIAALSLSGNDAAQSSTLLTNVLAKMLKPSQQAAEQLAGIGMTVESLQQHLDERGLLATLTMLKDRLGDNGFARFLEDQQAVQGALALTGENAERVRQVFGEVENSAGSFAQAWATWLGDPSTQMSRDLAALQVALVELGQELVPLATDLASFGAKAADAFSDLPDDVQKVAIGLGALGAAAGPLLMVGGALAKIAAIRMPAWIVGTGAAAGGASWLGLLPWTAYAAGDSAAAQGRRANLEAEMAGNGTPQSERTFFGLPVGDWMTGDVSGSFNPAAPRSPASWFLPGQAWSAPSPAPGARMAEAFGDPVSWIPKSGPPTFGPPPSFDMGLADAFAESAANLERLTEMTRQYALVTSSTDWGAAGFEAARTAMARFTSEQFALTNIAIASEQAFASLDEAIEKNGFTLDVATQAGQENMAALQGVASTLDTQFISAYDAANGSMSTFMASATQIGNETLKRLQSELGLTDEQTKALAETLGLTAKDYEARFHLSGDEEARQRLGLLSGVIGLLQDDVQREVAMRIATGDFQGALKLVQQNIAKTERNPTVTVSAVDKASGVIEGVKSSLAGLKSKSITITTNQITAYGTRDLGKLGKFALGGRVGPNGGIGGEAGLEYVDIGGFGAFIDRPTLLPPGAMVTPLSAGGSSGGSGGSFSGGGGTSINLVVNAGLGTDGYRVGQQIVDALAKYTRVNGPRAMQRIVAA